MEVQLDLQTKRCSIHFQYVHYFVGVLLRELGGDWFLGVLFASLMGVRKAEHAFDLDLIVPNSHDIFRSRVCFVFSVFLVPSGTSFGGSWIAI